MNPENAALSRPQPSRATPSRRDRRAGYTLTELIVVIVILGLLAAIVGQAVLGQISRARVQAASTQIDAFRNALMQYQFDHGRFPEAAHGLDALVTPPPGDDNWNGPYLQGGRELPDDPWGEAYIYDVVSGERVVITTLGADRREGGEGQNADIVREIF